MRRYLGARDRGGRAAAIHGVLASSGRDGGAVWKPRYVPCARAGSLYRRRHLRMPAGEAARIALGLVIPFVLIPHIIGMRVQHATFRVDDTYTQMILT